MSSCKTSTGFSRIPTLSEEKCGTKPFESGNTEKRLQIEKQNLTKVSVIRHDPTTDLENLTSIYLGMFT